MATVRSPSSLAARRMRMAISLRFSARSFFIGSVREQKCAFLRITGGANRVQPANSKSGNWWQSPLCGAHTDRHFRKSQRLQFDLGVIGPKLWSSSIFLIGLLDNAMLLF